MDNNTLQAFIAVAQWQSFSIAAEKLFITQSAISKRIALLEQQLDKKLFDRIGRQISLTNAGHALLPCAEKILMSFADARTVINNLDQTVNGTLSLASSHHIGLHRLPIVLRQFSQQFPQVQLNLSFGESEAAYTGVVKGHLELALITLAPLPDPVICAQKVWTDHMEFVVANDHSLTRQPSVSLSTLSRHQAILPGPKTFTRQMMSERFTAQGLSLEVSMSTNNLDTIKMMVVNGLGWSLLPASMIDDTIKVLKTDQPTIYRYLGFIYHRERTLSNAAKQFIKLLQD
ncbi:MAG: regulatory protein, LysR:LysR, substrate-binding protein [Osedax symbiont Rs1]|nr:MAG: regulatory protein, LysR:LysR, substrate-binding protein [Osedax symbiont Rs1]